MSAQATKYSRWSRWLCPVWTGFFRFFFRRQIRGRSNVPSSGALILAANHQSFFDGQLICCPVGRPVLFMVMASYFKVPVIGPFLRSTGCIPLGGSKSQDAYRAGLSVLEDGECLAIFPEGHRSRDGGLLRLHQGAARIAHTTGTPIVPISIVGAFEAWPRNRWLPRFFRPIVVKYHRPIPCPPVDKTQLRSASVATTEKLAAVLRRRLAAWDAIQRRRATQSR